MRISRSQLDQKLRSSLPSKFSRFIYTIHAIEHLCEETFAELYETKQGFQFSLDDANAKIPINDGGDYIGGAEFNQHFSTQKTHKPTPVKYKMYVDDGTAKDLRTRGVRINFINTLIQKIKSHSNLMRYGLKNGFVRLEVGSGGKNPTLDVQIKYEKKVLNRKTGKKEPKDISIILKLSLKSRSDKGEKDENPFKKFKPKVVQGLLGNKLSSSQFKNLLENYVNSLTISKASKQTFLKSIDFAYKDARLKVSSIGSAEFSSELFEVLSAMKLARIIETKNSAFLKKILGWNDEQINAVDKNQVKIFMPTSANEALVDYEVYYSQTNAIKVSVKSKLSSNPATVKFGTVFDSETEVAKWFNSIQNKTNSIRGSAIIAGDALSYKRRFSGKETLYPIKALYSLMMSSSFSSSAWLDMASKANLDVSMVNKNTMISILKKTHKSLGGAQYRYVPLDTLAGYTKDELADLKMFVAKNIKYTNRDITAAYVDIATKNTAPKEVIQKIRNRDRVSYSIMDSKDYPKLKGDDMYPFTLNNLAYLCEKAVVATSKKGSASEINFWQLFYDNVLSKKQVLYSVMKEYTTGNQLSLEYQFVSMINFSRYSKWVELRSKNNAFNMQDTLGMNV